MIAAIELMDERGLDTLPNMLKLSHTRPWITRAANESRTLLPKVLAILSQQPRAPRSPARWKCSSRCMPN